MLLLSALCGRGALCGERFQASPKARHEALPRDARSNGSAVPGPVGGGSAAGLALRGRASQRAQGEHWGRSPSFAPPTPSARIGKLFLDKPLEPV